MPIAFEPGTRWLYGFASELTAGLLEVIGGKAAELVIKEMLFDALGMDDSANFLNDRITEDRLVKGYYLVRGKKLGDEGDSNNAVRAVPVDHPITIRNAVAMMCGLPYCMFPNPNATDPTLAAMSRQMAKLMEGNDKDPTLREEVRAMAEVPIM